MGEMRNYGDAAILGQHGTALPLDSIQAVPRGRLMSDIGDSDPMCPHAMVAFKDLIVQAFFNNYISRDKLVVRGVFIPGRGIPELHVDTETEYFDIWIAIPNRTQFIVRRHRKEGYQREKWLFGIDVVADGYAQQYLNKIIGGILYHP